jgi:hypothetical protein
METLIECDGCGEMERDCTCPVYCFNCKVTLPRGVPCGCDDRDEWDEREKD